MSPWLRALVILFLLPAYCLAAIGVDAVLFTPAVDGLPVLEGQHVAESRGDGKTKAGVDLVSELGDTSDDAAELLTTALKPAPAAPVPSGIVVAPDARPAAHAPDRLLRPPRAPLLA